jgi:hypothetical protein
LKWLSSFAVVVALALAAALALHRHDRRSEPDAGSTGQAAGGVSPATARALWLLAHADAGLVLDGGSCDEEENSCPNDIEDAFFECCAGRCVNVTADPDHCGSCDTQCALGVACVDQVCERGCDGLGCPRGFTCMETGDCVPSSCDRSEEGAECALGPIVTGSCCGGQCLDVSQSSSHCGDCSTLCDAGTFCYLGSCEESVSCADAGDVACALNANQAGRCCEGRCLDETGDVRNCGTCGHLCGEGEVCLSGDCVALRCGGMPSDVDCLIDDQSPHGTCCDGRCLPRATFQADARNCGGCHAHCSRSSVCESGSCTEPDSGKPFSCQQGGCAPDEICMPDGICLHRGCGGADDNTVCAQSPELDGVCCHQVCVDVTQNQGNCGRCGAACDGGELCDDSMCKPFGGCGVGAGQCPLSAERNGICCGDQCVDTNADPANCGACGTACAAGRSCERGSCRAASCAGAQAGELCSLPSGEEAACCHGSCVAELSFQSDPQSCGSCGTRCPSGVSCEDGQCTDPDAGGPWSCAEHGCPAGQSCVNGSDCLPVSCSGSEDGLSCASPVRDGLGACCQGQCVDLRLDSLNCGTCGNACGPAAFCAFGSCEPFNGCDAGGSPCPLGAQHLGLCCAAGCLDVQSDPANCGRCGVACDPGERCVDFECVATRSSAEP